VKSYSEKSYSEFEDHPALDDFKFIRKTKFPANLFSSPASLPVLHKFIQKHHKKEKTVFWPDLVSTHYAKNMLAGLEELNINYIPKKKSTNGPTATAGQKFLGLLKKEGVQQQLSSKRCKVHHGKDPKRAKVH
jgi:hypothetical protein